MLILVETPRLKAAMMKVSASYCSVQVPSRNGDEKS